MTTQTPINKEGVVKNIRKIRDQISLEIKDMSFEQERAYLNKLLSEKQQPVVSSIGYNKLH